VARVRHGQRQHLVRTRALGMGVLGSTPFAAAQPDGTIDVFWRGSGDGHLWHAYYRAGHGWAGPQSLGGDLYPMP